MSVLIIPCFRDFIQGRTFFNLLYALVNLLCGSIKAMNSSLKLCKLSCRSAKGCPSPGALAQCAAYPKVQYLPSTSAMIVSDWGTVLSAVHDNDVFVRMATCSGKSLHMFLRPLSVSDAAMGVIVSPLNGLWMNT